MISILSLHILEFLKCFRFKDGRRLIYDNLQDIVTQTIMELDTKYGQSLLQKSVQEI